MAHLPHQTTLKVPDLILLVGTRVALGIGVGLLVAGALDERARKAAGIALLATGILTTVPIAWNLRSSMSRPSEGATSFGESPMRE
jgi:hypothetical protein